MIYVHSRGTEENLELPRCHTVCVRKSLVKVITFVPEGTVKLIVKRNPNLERIAPLPSTLVELVISHNPNLHTIVSLHSHIQKLHITDNPLFSLVYPLPNLTVLEYDKSLQSCEPLPVNLRELHCRDYFPILPPALQVLRCTNIMNVSITPTFPSSIQMLFYRHSPDLRLITSLPDDLYHLDVCYNENLERLPRLPLKLCRGDSPYPSKILRARYCPSLEGIPHAKYSNKWIVQTDYTPSKRNIKSVFSRPSLADLALIRVHELKLKIDITELKERLLNFEYCIRCDSLMVEKQVLIYFGSTHQLRYAWCRKCWTTGWERHIPLYEYNANKEAREGPGPIESLYLVTKSSRKI